MRRPRTYDDDENWFGDNLPKLEVHVDDDPQPSGLLNKDGHPLVRHRRPVGFLNFDTED